MRNLGNVHLDEIGLEQVSDSLRNKIQRVRKLLLEAAPQWGLNHPLQVSPELSDFFIAVLCRYTGLHNPKNADEAKALNSFIGMIPAL